MQDSMRTINFYPYFLYHDVLCVALVIETDGTFNDKFKGPFAISDEMSIETLDIFSASLV